MSNIGRDIADLLLSEDRAVLASVDLGPYARDDLFGEPLEGVIHH